MSSRAKGGEHAGLSASAPGDERFWLVVLHHRSVLISVRTFDQAELVEPGLTSRCALRI